MLDRPETAARRRSEGGGVGSGGPAHPDQTAGFVGRYLDIVDKSADDGQAHLVLAVEIVRQTVRMGVLTGVRPGAGAVLAGAL
jgi:hypothetical protein